MHALVDSEAVCVVMDKEYVLDKKRVVASEIQLQSANLKKMNVIRQYSFEMVFFVFGP